MKFILISFLFLVGCATTDQSMIIQVPKPSKNVEAENISLAKKNHVKIGSKGSTQFDFFAGPRGSYFIVVSGRVINLNNYDCYLEVDQNGTNPESISLAVEKGSEALSGFGSVRDGVFEFTLNLIPIDKSIGSPIILPFKAKLFDYY